MSENKMLTLRASRAPDGRAKIEAVIGDDVLAADVIDLWSDADRDRFANAIHSAVPTLPLPCPLQRFPLERRPISVGHLRKRRHRFQSTSPNAPAARQCSRATIPGSIVAR